MVEDIGDPRPIARGPRFDCDQDINEKAGSPREKRLPQCCQDWGRLWGTPGDWRAQPNGGNVMRDKDLLPEVLCHHSLRKSRGSGSTPAAAHPQGCAGERPGVSKVVLTTREAHRLILIERDARGADGHGGWRVLPGPQGGSLQGPVMGDNPVELLATTG